MSVVLEESPLAPYDVEAIRRDFPVLSRTVYGKPLTYLDNGASAQKPQAGDRPHRARLWPRTTPTSIAACISSRPPSTEAYEAAREHGAALPERRFAGRDHLHPLLDRGAQPRRLRARRQPRRGRRDRPVDHGAPLQHRAVAFSPRAKGAVLKWVPVGDDGSFSLEDFERTLTAADQDRRHHPYVERPRHRRADQGSGRDRP